MNSHSVAQNPRVPRLLVLATSILVLIIGNFAARLSHVLLGEWAWIGSSLFYWGSMTLIITNAFDAANPTALIPFWTILVILSLAFCLLYLKTKSLRLPILAHFLSDLGNLSIFLFMNLIVM